MLTGRRNRAARGAALALACAVLAAGTGCDEIEPPRVPVVAVTLVSQPAIIMGTSPVQLLATVTEDGVPQENLQVLFSASRGRFSGDQVTTTKVTDAVGLVVATLTLADDDDATPVEVIATAVEAETMGMLTLTVERAGGR